MPKPPPQPYPSEFEPDEQELILSVMKSRGFHLARMVGASKTTYVDRNPKNFVVFNANIVTLKEGKVWYGDLDLTKDAAKLADIAGEVGETLYVLRESDARFEKANIKPDELVKKAVWNTTMGVPRYEGDYEVVYSPTKKG